MEWFDKISEFMEGLPEWLQAHPRYGYLIVAGILLLWLVGIVCGWRWTYSLEKPRDFDPFGHAGFAHLWLQYD